MITFMDLAFCSAYGKTCATHDCYRAMNAEMTDIFLKWAGDSKYAAVSYMDMSDGCAQKTEIMETTQ